jgi:hypothetical protein
MRLIRLRLLLLIVWLNPQIDPNTGEAVALSPELLQNTIDAGLKPLVFENSATHLENHSLFMKSEEFEDQFLWMFRSVSISILS